MYGLIGPPPPRPGPERKPQEPSSRDQRGPTRPAAPKEWNLHLESAGTDIPAGFLAGSPSTAVLAVEDVCWEAAVEDWKHRRPRRWRVRARTAWEAEGLWLAAKADHLRHLADEVLREL